jgi:hypothetical protein
MKADVMTPETSETKEKPRIVPDKPRPCVAVDIAGDGLLLRGHFRAWESGLSFGPDLDRIGVRLAVDATSAAAGDHDGCLFSFRSRSVEAVGSGTFRADGVLEGARGARPLDVVVETPPGHSAVFILSFGADKGDLGERWHDLIENVVPFPRAKDGEPVRLAHAWLTPPVLAAA